jgi:hypothetical protein
MDRSWYRASRFALICVWQPNSGVYSMDEKFRKAEEEYFILRGKYDTGRIGKDLFELAVKDLMVQDNQGRWWMLGAENGKWYLHDGKEWLEADPSKVTPAKAATTAKPKMPGESSRGPNKILIAAIGCVALVCLLGVGALVLFSVFGFPRSGLFAARPTPAFFLTPAFIAITSPTLSSVSQPTLTSTALATDTPILPTNTPTRRPTATPTLAFAPGVYVTALRSDPSPPVRREEVTFYATFLNTTGQEQSYRWFVYVYRADATRPFGQTASDRVYSIPTGAIELQTVNAWRLTGPGGCENFVARIVWLDSNNQPQLFVKPEGTVFELPFTIC